MVKLVEPNRKVAPMDQALYSCKEEVLKEIRARFEAKMPLAFIIVAKQDAALLHAAISYCDSWSKAVIEAGLSITDVCKYCEKYI